MQWVLHPVAAPTRVANMMTETVQTTFLRRNGQFNLTYAATIDFER